jgi:hypothetical protein
MPHLAPPTAGLSHSQGTRRDEWHSASARNNVFPPMKKSKRPGTPHATAHTRPAEVSPQPKPAELFERRVIIVFPPHADGPAFGFSKGGVVVVGASWLLWCRFRYSFSSPIPRTCCDYYQSSP